ncbi:MAG: hypothetical protein HY777_07705 [Betaproteobacteria bacterium]|nr:hypothetical protein [Betaproteobacteria bacterium]
MPSAPALAQIPDVWCGNTPVGAPVPTGFAELDAELPGGGLIELLPERGVVGELALLPPVLARLSSDEFSWLVCVAPPYLLHAPALEEGGGGQLRVRLLKRCGGARPEPLSVPVPRPVRLPDFCAHALASPASAPTAARIAGSGR